MKFELEHQDVCRALSAYLRTKNVKVSEAPANFKMTLENDEISVVVRNADFVPAEPIAPPPPARPVAASATGLREPASAPAPVKPKKPTPARNDPFIPVAPPSRVPPAPKHRVLDAQAAGSLGTRSMTLSDGTIIVPSEVVNDFRGSEKEYVDEVEDESPPVAAQPAALPAAPMEALDAETLREMDEILARSAEMAEQSPPRGDTGGPKGLDDLGAGEFLDE
jgi:hypothetical protein